MIAEPIALHPASRLAKRTVRGLDIIASAPRSSPLVAGLFGTGSLVVLYGAPGSGKSFLALDLALSVVSGHKFHGREVLSGPAIYVVAEGLGGIGQRVDAWMDAHGGDISAVHWLTSPIALADRAQVADLADLVAHVSPALVVFDTLARCIPGTDENSASEMGRVIGNLDALLEASNTTIALLHHAGKDQAKGLRGSTALTGAADTILLCTRTRAGVTLTTTKQKDACGDEVERFRLDRRRESAVLTLDDGTEPFRPTVLMTRVSDYLASHPGASFSDILTNVTGKTQGIRLAVDALRGTYVAIESGPNANDAQRHTLFGPSVRTGHEPRFPFPERFPRVLRKRAPPGVFPFPPSTRGETGNGGHTPLTGDVAPERLARRPPRSLAAAPRAVRSPAVAVDEFIDRDARSAEGRPAHLHVVRRSVTDSNRPEQCVLIGNAELTHQFALAVEDAEVPTAEALVDRGEQDRHDRHPGVDVPERDRPCFLLLQAEAGLVRRGVAIQVGGLRGEGERNDRRSVRDQVVKFRELVRRRRRAPEPLDAIGIIQDNEPESLAEAARGRVARSLQDAQQRLFDDGLPSEPVDHAAPSDDIAKLHARHLIKRRLHCAGCTHALVASQHPMAPPGSNSRHQRKTTDLTP